MHVTGLFLYPVKSLRGCAVTAADLDGLGFAGDRRFLIVDRSGRFLTQRTVPRMACIDARLDADSLTLSAEGRKPLIIGSASEPVAPLRTISIWKSEGLLAEDCGAAAAKWLGSFLKLECHLVRIGRKFHRPIVKSTARPGDCVSFADAYPFLVVSEASLADLNDRLAERGEEPVPMDRFRPNLVVTGCAPYGEDTWPRVRIGAGIFRRGGPCSRCIVTTTDQLTGERAHEPLRTLASYRRDPAEPTDVNFGQNLINESKQGTIRLGDPVEPLPA